MYNFRLHTTKNNHNNHNHNNHNHNNHNHNNHNHNHNNHNHNHNNHNKGSKTITLYSQPYLDTYNQCYKNIVTINMKPRGPLEQLVRYIQFPKLSEFKQSTPCNPMKKCGFALISLNHYSCNNDLMIVDEIPNLVSFLMEHNYTFDTSLTKMFNTTEIRFETNSGNKLIGFVTYNGVN